MRTCVSYGAVAGAFQRSQRGRALAWIVLASLFLSHPPSVSAWGDETHRMINEEAITTLPEPLRSFFTANRRELSNRAVEPDSVLRPRYGRREAVRHFIDLDLYGSPPFSELPRSYGVAVRRFGRDTVVERGTLPWTVLRMHARLAREMRAGDWVAALRTAGLGGHYVGDAFMPLHTTDNYDGQKTGQRGIHHAIEDSLVDARIDAFRGRVRVQIRPASAAPFTPERVFAFLLESYSDVSVVLRADREARKLGRMGSARYLDTLDERTGNVLGARLASGATTLGSFWLSAWAKAGSPAPPAR